MRHRIGTLALHPKRFAADVIQDTYLAKNHGLGMAYFMLCGYALVGTALSAMFILLCTGLVCLPVYFVLLWQGLPMVADKVILVPAIAAVLGGLVFSWALGAETSIHEYKEFVFLPLDEFEEALDDLSFPGQCALRREISDCISRKVRESFEGVVHEGEAR